MKINIPESFQFCSLKNLSKNPPDKKILLWGKIKGFNFNKRELVLEDDEGDELISLSDEVVEKDVSIFDNKDDIVKIFCFTTMEGIKIEKIVVWNGLFDQFVKLKQIHFG